MCSLSVLHHPSCRMGKYIPVSTQDVSDLVLGPLVLLHLFYLILTAILEKWGEWKWQDRTKWLNHITLLAQLWWLFNLSQTLSVSPSWLLLFQWFIEYTKRWRRDLRIAVSIIFSNFAINLVLLSLWVTYLVACFSYITSEWSKGTIPERINQSLKNSI